MGELIYIKISRGLCRVTNEQIIQILNQLGLNVLSIFDTKNNRWPVIEVMLIEPKTMKGGDTSARFDY